MVDKKATVRRIFDEVINQGQIDATTERSARALADWSVPVPACSRLTEGAVAARTPAKKVGSSPARNGPSERLGVAKHSRSRKRGPVERPSLATRRRRRTINSCPGPPPTRT